MNKLSKTSTVSEYLDQEYSQYGLYVIEHRAIPSVIDGFKPTQRKIIYIADKVWRLGSEKPLKIFQLGGRIAADASYHHGDGSLNTAIIGMAQSFRNSLPLLEDIGQFGSLRSPEAGAPRYISTRLTKNFRLLYKDFELLDPQFDEGNQIEPKYFLPIIPTVLLNGTSGIAVGFSTTILNRNALDLIEACQRTLDGKDFDDLLPWWSEYTGQVTKVGDTNQYSMRGTYEVVNTTTVKITELPPSMTLQKYDAHLTSLAEKGTIVSYDDNSAASVNYTLKFARATLADLIQRDKLDQTLKMIEMETENLTCLNEHGKLIIFNSVKEVVHYFVKFRLGFYTKRKDFIIDKITKDLIFLTNRAKFVKYIVEGNLEINNRQKIEIIADLDFYSFAKIDGNYNYLLNMPIHSLTHETYYSLMQDVDVARLDLEKINKTQPIDMYKLDLVDLKKNLKSKR